MFGKTANNIVIDGIDRDACATQPGCEMAR
jgi:hypothetical protein